MSRILFLTIGVCVLIANGAEARGHRRSHKYSLNPDKAEQILAGIAVRPQLGADEWLKLLGADRKIASADDLGQGPTTPDPKDRKYQVGPGENLWNVSRKLASSPRHWAKLWQLNPTITNPHEIEVGKILDLYNEKADSNVVRVPLVKLSPNRITDIDNNTFANTDIKNRLQPKVMVIDESTIKGEITGAYTQKDALGLHEEIFASFTNREEVKVGDAFSVVRFDRALYDSGRSSKVIGNLMRLLGQVKVVKAGEKLFVVEITDMYQPIRRSDHLVPLLKVSQTSLVKRTPDDFDARIVTGEEAERRAFVQGDMVLLNKGRADGMDEGFFFRVHSDRDPVLNDTKGVEPTYIGEVLVVQVSELASVGYVIRNNEPIFIGDTLVASQKFTNPPSFKSKLKPAVEIN